MKKVKNNSQKSPTFAALRSAAKAMAIGLPGAGAASAGASLLSPRRRRPIEEGCSGSTSATMGKTSAAAAATSSTMGRHP